MISAPRLAIIVPVYGHPVLVSEALDSALMQEADFDIHIVVVNDGCPYEETDLVLSAFALAHPGRVTYLAKPNGGLSSARNAGIRYVLRCLPSVQALFMLDADNRLRPTAMARAMAFLDANPQAGWVYPSIDMFGIPARRDYGGPYSRLIHSEMNISEAGSLIRRAVFEAGVMFDETFKQGFEDWDFFLSAGDAGFVGVNLEEFGFLYRKRPESMLADTDRQHAVRVAQLRAAHPDLYRPATQLRLEHAEAPRYAIWCADRDEVRLVTDPELPGPVLTRVEYARAFWHARTAPGQARVPPFMVVTDANTLEALSAVGVLHWALWQLELAAGEGMARARLAPPPQKGEIAIQSAAPTPGEAALWILGVDALAALLAGPVPVDPEMSVDDGPPCTALAFRMETADIVHGATEALRGALEELHGSPWRRAGQGAPHHTAGPPRWIWRQVSIGWRGKEHRILRKSFGKQPPLPRVPGSDAAPEIGVIVDSVKISGLDAVLVRLQKARADGARLTLFIMDKTTGRGGATLRDQVDSIVLLGASDFTGHDHPRDRFNGVAMTVPDRPALDDRAWAMMAALDEVHVTECPGVERLLAPLRRQGVTTVLHLSATSDQRALTQALAYEHAYDRIVTTDARQRALLHACGIPAAKRDGPGS